MRRFFAMLIWFVRGEPMVELNGCHCGLCGAWIPVPIRIPRYQSKDEHAWGLCSQCKWQPTARIGEANGMEED